MVYARNVVAFAICLAFQLPCAARVYRMELDFKDAVGKSDMVVIGHAVGTNMVQTGVKLEDYPAIEVETTFRIDAVLKGDTNATDVTMFHYRLDSRKFDVWFNGPATVSFSTDGAASYLLFLKRDEKSRLVPVYGQGDAAGSVFRLTSEFEAGWMTEENGSTESPSDRAPELLPHGAVLTQMAGLSNSVERLTRRLTLIEAEWRRIKPSLKPILEMLDELRYKPTVEEELIGAKDDE